MDASHPPSVILQGRHENLREDLLELPRSVDTSDALFSMYLERSDDDDRKITKKWKGETDAMLIFTGLFSAALAAFLAVSIQDLRPSSQDTSAFYVANIYLLLANITGSQPLIIPSPSNPAQFSPSTSAVLVNSLWFLSLVLSLTGALLAVSVQQWAQSYLQATQRRHSPRNRARIRSFYAKGIDKHRLPQVTRVVPTLIHASLVLFFFGLQVFLFHINLTVFKVILILLGLCVIGYAYVTLIPIFCPDSPYRSPLSSSIWLCFTSTLYVIYWLLKDFTHHDSPVHQRCDAHYARLHPNLQPSRGMQEEADGTALQMSPDIDYSALSWMFGTLNNDDEYEQFFDALPGLCTSEVLKDSHEDFIKPHDVVLSHALIGLMNRTLSSNLVSDHVKQRRIIICTKAIDATSLIGHWWILHHVLGDWHRFLGCIEFGLFVKSWNITDRVTAFYAQCVVAVVVASAQEREEPWCQLTRSHLNMSKHLLQDYLASGDSILLANATFIVQRAIDTYTASTGRHRSLVLGGLSKTLELVFKFDIENTLPGLQHEFCSLWNQLIVFALNDNNSQPISMITLKGIRRFFIALHKCTTDSPTAFSSTTDEVDPVLDDLRSYPMCTLAEHRTSLPAPQSQLDEPPTDAAENSPYALASATETIPALDPAVIVQPPTVPVPPHLPTSPALTQPSTPTQVSAPFVDPNAHSATVIPTGVIPSTSTGPSSATPTSSGFPNDHLIVQPNPIPASISSSISNFPITFFPAQATEGAPTTSPQSPSEVQNTLRVPSLSDDHREEPPMQGPHHGGPA